MKLLEHRPEAGRPVEDRPVEFRKCRLCCALPSGLKRRDPSDRTARVRTAMIEIYKVDVLASTSTKSWSHWMVCSQLFGRLRSLPLKM